MTSFAAIILAAGKGTRMRSNTPKPLHPVCGTPMARIVANSAMDAGLDPVILDSKPRGVFDRAALDAVAKFRYEPKVVDGKPQETVGVRNRIVFEIAD